MGRREMAALFEQYADQLALIAAEEAGKEGFMERVRGRLREAMGLNAVSPETIDIVPFVKDRVASLTPLFSHREVRIRID